MNAHEFAATLAGATYCNEISREQEAQAKANGLVIVFGASDDLMEFRGAIHDELGANDGTTAYLTSAGLLQNDCDSGEDCPHYEKQIERATTIEALWCKEDGYSWTFATEIPHATFEVTEDDEPYCRGIVFALADVQTQPEASTKAEEAVESLADLVMQQEQLIALLEAERNSLREVVTHTAETIRRQLDLIDERAGASVYLDRKPVVQSLTAHHRRLTAALECAGTAPEQSNG